MGFAAKIDKDAVNLLPTVAFDGEIRLIRTTQEAEKAIDELLQHKTVGIDTETRPSFQKGHSYPVALLQVATLSTCYLFRLNQIGATDSIGRFFESESVVKVGLSLHDDLRALGKRYRFCAKNCIDIQNIVKDYGIFEMSLQKVFAIVFGRKISKAQRLTNWEQSELNESQQQYAATDAWATLLLYEQLRHSRLISTKERMRIETELAHEQEERCKHLNKEKANV